LLGTAFISSMVRLTPVPLLHAALSRNVLLLSARHRPPTDWNTLTSMSSHRPTWSTVLRKQWQLCYPGWSYIFVPSNSRYM